MFKYILYFDGVLECDSVRKGSIMDNLDKLVFELLELPRETQWVEFKCNNYNPKTIGQDISALANGAALQDKENAYFIWGIDNDTHDSISISK